MSKFSLLKNLMLVACAAASMQCVASLAQADNSFKPGNGIGNLNLPAPVPAPLKPAGQIITVDGDTPGACDKHKGTESETDKYQFGSDGNCVRITTFICNDGFSFEGFSLAPPFKCGVPLPLSTLPLGVGF